MEEIVVEKFLDIQKLCGKILAANSVENREFLWNLFTRTYIRLPMLEVKRFVFEDQYKIQIEKDCLQIFFTTRKNLLKSLCDFHLSIFQF